VCTILKKKREEEGRGEGRGGGGGGTGRRDEKTVNRNQPWNDRDLQYTDVQRRKGKGMSNE
jgi:hypothetical protein